MNSLNPAELNDERLDELLGQCERETPAPHDEFSARLRATLLAETRAVGVGSAPSQARHHSRRTFARVAIAAGIAVAVLWSFWLRTPSSWAQVQAALNSKPWIHLRAKLDDGTTQENWISILQQRAAFRAGPSARYSDVRNDLQFDYEPSRGTVVRTPLRASQSPDSMLALFDQVLRGKNPEVSELDHAKVIETRSRKVLDDGKEWLDVELTLQRRGADLATSAVMRMEFRVDPANKLPRTLTLTVLAPAANAPADSAKRLVYEIDYPAEGPEDIYALGISRDAKLDDRVPPEDTSRALKAIAAGRRDFDPYFAIVFSAGSVDKPYNGLPTAVVWRRGNQARVELCRPFEPFKPYSDKPADTNDLTWWREQLKHFRFLPVAMCDGKTGYTTEFSQPDAQGIQRVSSWKPLAVIPQGESLSEYQISPARGNFPEFFAYPFVEVSDVATVKLVPAMTSEQPHGGLLTVAFSGKHPRGYLRNRYWLDADRGYAATRLNFDQLDVPREEAVANKDCVEDESSMSRFQRSPKGFWYPTFVVRSVANEPAAATEKRELKQQESKSFLVDFDAEMFDSLFTTKERKTAP